MSEFDRGDHPDFSIGMPFADFSPAFMDMVDELQDDDMYEVIAGCLEEDPSEQGQKELGLKLGLLYKYRGHIEQRRGEYPDALASYRQARAEITDFDEILSMQLYTVEGHMLIHELDDPAGSIEPYEEMMRIFEERFSGQPAMPAPHYLFESYTDVASHLAGAYERTGQAEKVREVSAKLLVLGRMSGAMFGFDRCEHDPSAEQVAAQYEQRPLFKEIHDKLLSGFSREEPEQQIEGLQSLEAIIDTEDFMPEAPEQRDYVLMMIYGRYGMLMPDVMEQRTYIEKALKIATQHKLLVPKTQLYLSLGDNLVRQGRPLKEQHKVTKKALLAAEASMDAGASPEAAYTSTVASVLSVQYAAMNDYIGSEKLRRRLAARGLELQNTAPGAAKPWLN